MREVRRKIKPTDKVYTVAEFVNLLEKNRYSYKFSPGELHYANSKDIYITHVSGNGELVRSYTQEYTEVTHIVLLEQPE